MSGGNSRHFNAKPVIYTNTQVKPSYLYLDKHFSALAHSFD